MRHARGFTLIELAMVMLILALLIGGALSTVKVQMEKQRVSDTQKALSDAREAILGFAIQNRRLPRPAAAAGIGAEGPPCASATQCSGFLPWATLGLPAGDAYGMQIRYVASVALSGNGAGSNCITTAATGSVTLQGRVPGPGLSNQVTGLPYVLVSQGARNLGVTQGGTPRADNGGGLNLDELQNETPTLVGSEVAVVSRPVSADPATPGGEFDDLLAWDSLYTLVNRIAAANPNALAAGTCTN